MASELNAVNRTTQWPLVRAITNGYLSQLVQRIVSIFRSINFFSAAVNRCKCFSSRQMAQAISKSQDAQLNGASLAIRRKKNLTKLDIAPREQPIYYFTKNLTQPASPPDEFFTPRSSPDEFFTPPSSPKRPKSIPLPPVQENVLEKDKAKAAAMDEYLLFAATQLERRWKETPIDGVLQQLLPPNYTIKVDGMFTPSGDPAKGKFMLDQEVILEWEYSIGKEPTDPTELILKAPEVVSEATRKFLARLPHFITNGNKELIIDRFVPSTHRLSLPLSIYVTGDQVSLKGTFTSAKEETRSFKAHFPLRMSDEAKNKMSWAIRCAVNCIETLIHKTYGKVARHRMQATAQKEIQWSYVPASHIFSFKGGLAMTSTIQPKHRGDIQSYHSYVLEDSESEKLRSHPAYIEWVNSPNFILQATIRRVYFELGKPNHVGFLVYTDLEKPGSPLASQTLIRAGTDYTKKQFRAIFEHLDWNKSQEEITRLEQLRKEMGQ